MKALLWTKAERMEYVEMDRPVPQQNEVLIEVLVVGICGSELEGYLGHNSLRVPPLLMGHEFCGRIVETGNPDSALAVGQKVTVNPLIACGRCRACIRGRVQLCEQRRIIGIHRPGAFAHYVVVPEACVVPVAEHLPAMRMALSEPLACSLRAVRRAYEQGHSLPNVLVFGAGGIGILCAAVARLLGADEVIIADTNDSRLEIVHSIGFTRTVNPKSANWKEDVQRHAGTKGIDVVIDAAGFQPTRESGIRLLNTGGTLMNIGLGIEDTVLPINTTIRSEIDIIGSFCYTPKDFLDAVRLLEAGSITEAGWTRTAPLEEGDRSFQDLTRGRVHHGKILLLPNESAE